MLPPLEPQPMLNQTSDEGNSHAADNKEEGEKPSMTDMKRFECAICFEYMDDPVGCGSCQHRVCQSCLHRVLREETNNRPPQSTDPPKSAKCPHCRSFFTIQSIVLDKELKKEISDCTDTVTCPFQGCGTGLRIGLLKAHEAQCPFIRMRCRFADWGCEWVGRKKDIEDHDAHQCEFRGGLGKLVERFRQGDAQGDHILQQHHMQLSGAGQMLSLHSRQMMMIRGKNAGDLFQTLHLAYEASLFPGRFNATGEMWISLIGKEESRCIVCNILLLVPSLALIFNVSFQGFKLLSRLQIETLSGDDVWFLVDTLLLSLIVSMLGILCMACFFIDTKSPRDWTIYNIRNLVPGQPILRDLAAICMAMTHFSAIEFLGPHPGIMIWHLIGILTIFFTSFVSRIIEKNEPSSSNVGTLRIARAFSVVIFGLRYGLLAAMCGFAPSVNAVVTLRLLKQTAMVSSKVTVEDSECFIPQFGVGFLIAISGLSTALEYATDLNAVSWWNVLLDWAFSTAVLAYANAFVFLLDKAGRKLGETNFDMGRRMFMQAHRSSGALLPNTQPTPIGCLVFGLCSFLLLCIAAA